MLNIIASSTSILRAVAAGSDVQMHVGGCWPGCGGVASCDSAIAASSSLHLALPVSAAVFPPGQFSDLVAVGSGAGIHGGGATSRSGIK